MKRFQTTLCLFLAALFLLLPFGAAAEEPPEEPVTAAAAEEIAPNCRSAILMEATTGTVLYEQNADEALPPASVTKVMTLLLLMEAVDSGALTLDDTVTVSANAASMGGSQVFLKEGEQMRLEDLLKCVVIASANDAAVALAEHHSGSVAAFVSRMNERAAELGMEHTHFENATGLDDTVDDHLTSARDIAVMSRALISHRAILNYSSIWMDTIRDGAFGLTNTNRLVRFYPGCTGLKTGSTARAGFCVSATAEREGLSLICVIMGADSRDHRNAAAAALLDRGFANFALYSAPAGECDPVRVSGGTANLCPVSYGAFSCVLPKEQVKKAERTVEIRNVLNAPVAAGETVGNVIYRVGETEIGRVPVTASAAVEKIGLPEILRRTFMRFLLV